MRYTTVRTAWGWLALAAGSYGLWTLVLPHPEEEETVAILREKAGAAALILDPTAFGDVPDRLAAYFGGERVSFAVDEIDWTGMTPFQREVFAAARQIPYGEVRSYKWVAQCINRSRAFQAVGQALKANRLPVIIPCHRVICQAGDLGGFREGHAFKERLLALEGVATASLARRAI
jgi:O-6-methylguanine DNA methyltransferase